MNDSTTLSRRSILGAAALGALGLAMPSGAEADEAPTGTLAPLMAVLRAHDKAYLAHDAAGVLATMTPDIFVLGTSTGEIWKGQKEVGEAYAHFFQDFDTNGQTFEPDFFEGGIDGNLGLFAATAKATSTKDGKTTTFGLNLSVAFAKVGDKWLIKAMHYSTAPADKA